MRKRTKSKLKPKVGSLLISEPFNPDASFKRSVVLLSQSGIKGTIGFIINKPTQLRVNEALDDFPEVDACLYWGGSIKTDSVYYLHSIKGLKGAKKIAEGIYWGGDYTQLKLLIESGEADPDDIKFMAGFSAWTPEEIEAQLKTESWWVTKADSFSVFIEEPTEVWGNVLQRMGHVYGILNDFPVDPEMN